MVTIVVPHWLVGLAAVYFVVGIWSKWLQIVKLRKISRMADAALEAGPFPHGRPSRVEFE